MDFPVLKETNIGIIGVGKVSQFIIDYLLAKGFRNISLLTRESPKKEEELRIIKDIATRHKTALQDYPIEKFYNFVKNSEILILAAGSYNAKDLFSIDFLEITKNVGKEKKEELEKSFELYNELRKLDVDYRVQEMLPTTAPIASYYGKLLKETGFERVLINFMNSIDENNTIIATEWENPFLVVGAGGVMDSQRLRSREVIEIIIEYLKQSSKEFLFEFQRKTRKIEEMYAYTLGLHGKDVVIPFYNFSVGIYSYDEIVSHIKKEEKERMEKEILEYVELYAKNNKRYGLDITKWGASALDEIFTLIEKGPNYKTPCSLSIMVQNKKFEYPVFLNMPTGKKTPAISGITSSTFNPLIEPEKTLTPEDYDKFLKIYGKTNQVIELLTKFGFITKRKKIEEITSRKAEKINIIKEIIREPVFSEQEIKKIKQEIADELKKEVPKPNIEEIVAKVTQEIEDKIPEPIDTFSLKKELGQELEQKIKSQPNISIESIKDIVKTQVIQEVKKKARSRPKKKVKIVKEKVYVPYRSYAMADYRRRKQERLARILQFTSLTFLISIIGYGIYYIENRIWDKKEKNPKTGVTYYQEDMWFNKSKLLVESPGKNKILYVYSREDLTLFKVKKSKNYWLWLIGIGDKYVIDDELPEKRKEILKSMFQKDYGDYIRTRESNVP